MHTTTLILILVALLVLAGVIVRILKGAETNERS
jgi:hypothetical protein